MKATGLLFCSLALLYIERMTRRAEVLNKVQILTEQFCPRIEPFDCDGNSSGIEMSTCCTGCSCDENCSLYDNCCYENSTSEVIGRESIVSCLSSNTKGSSIEETDDPWYKFIVRPPLDGCVKNGSCKYPNKSIPWKTFYPVYSLSTKKNYVTEDCANCHGITDGIKWTSTISIDSIFTYNTEDILRNLMTGESNKLFVKFKHPIDGPQKFYGLCSKIVRDRCPDVDQQKAHTILQRTTIKKIHNVTLSYDESKKLCLNGPKTNFFSKAIMYKNIFCSLCSDTIPTERQCLPDPKFGDRSFIQMIDHDIITDLIHTVYSSTKRRIPKVCRGNVISREGVNKTMCRVLFCPHLQVRTEDGKCRFTAKIWRVHGLMLSLRLTTQYRYYVYPTQLFPNRTDTEIKQLFYQNTPWDKQRWNIMNVGMRFYNTNDSTNIEFIIQLASNVEYINPKRSLETIKRSLQKLWIVKTFIGKLYLDQDFLQYGAGLEKVQRDNGIAVKPTFHIDMTHIDVFADALFKSNVNRTVLSLPHWDVLHFNSRLWKKTPFLVVNKMFYCNQIELEADEFYIVSKFHRIIWIKRTMHFLYNEEISTNRLWNTGLLKVKVCIGDSGLKISTARSSMYEASLVLLFGCIIAYINVVIQLQIGIIKL